MKYYAFLFTLLTALTGFSEAPRDWTLNSGKYFLATFNEIAGDKVSLTLENGKAGAIPIESLSVADRYYLHTQHDIPTEQLEGGNIMTAERDVKINTKTFKKVPSVALSGPGYEVNLQGLITPHFLILHDKGTKPAIYAEALERVHFSHRYRHPDHAEHWGTKRRVFLYIKDMDLYESLGKALVDNLRKEGTMKNRQINQVEANWSQYPGHNPWHLPKDLQEKFNAEQNVDIEFSENKQKDRINQAVGLYIWRWHWYYTHRRFIMASVPGGSELRIADPRQNSMAFCLSTAITAANDIIAHNESTFGTGAGLDQTGKHTMGRYGETKPWTSAISKKVSKGQVDSDFERFYLAPSNDEKATPADVYRDFGMLVFSLGRFMEQDLEHMFGKCKLSEFMLSQRRVPNYDEFPEIFGYESKEALNAAFKDFVIKKNPRMK